MKQVLLTLTLFSLVLFATAKDNSFLGKTIRQVQSTNQFDYKLVSTSDHKMSFMISKLADTSTIVYYFEDSICTSYTIVWRKIPLQIAKKTLDTSFVKKNNYWWSKEMNAKITVKECSGLLFLNVIEKKS